MAYRVPNKRQEAEKALDDGRLFVQMASGVWWVMRRNGSTKTWQKRPWLFRIPFKAGMRSYGYVTETNFLSFRIAASPEEARADNEQRSYTIMINEEQRVLLMKCAVTLALVDKGEELQLLVELLGELPEVEEKDPGVIHGFCL